MNKIEKALSDTLDHTIFLSKSDFSDVSTSKINSQRLCVTPLVIRAMHKAHAINILAKEDLIEEAETTLRVLIEVSFVIGAIKEDDNFALHYGLSAWIQKRFQLESLIKGNSELREPIIEKEKVDILKRQLETVKQTIKRNGAQKIGVKEYAKKANQLAIYYTVYSELSSTIHSGPEDLERYIEFSPLDKIMKIGPPRKTRLDVLFWCSIEAMMRVLRDASSVFGFSILGIKNLEKVYQSITAMLFEERKNSNQAR